MINVNQELCIGCGACTAECPNTFKLDEEGKSQVISQDDIECAKRAEDVCPVQALSVS